MSLELHPRVLELIASKICHDLVSPVGAISNGVELIEELGESAAGDAMALISSSAEQASRRLKFFRLAYGAAGTDKNMGIKDMQEAFNAWVFASVGENIKVTYASDLALKFSMPPRGFLKTVLNMLALAAECTHGAGTIDVSVAEEGNGIKIIAAGAKVKFRDNAELALAGEISPDDLDARSVHAFISGKLLNYFNVNMVKEVSPDDSKISIKLHF